MLKYLELDNVGPAASMALEFGERLNVITGDNGLGKSFLLDIAWWTYTGKWPAEVNPRLTAGKKALPRGDGEVAISASYAKTTPDSPFTSIFLREAQTWSSAPELRGKGGLVFYAMADGSFAVWDPVRNHTDWRIPGSFVPPAAYVFSQAEVWNGLLGGDDQTLCNGLIRDWASWQKEKGAAWDYLCEVLKVLSPAPDETLLPGDLTRISLDDVRDMPTIRMPYGKDVAVLHASSGMRRIIALAYFLVWCWEEHQRAAKLLGKPLSTQALFLVDEMEAHLHPKWQRRIVPALLAVMQKLASEFEVQLITATHSPLIMASLEPMFDPQIDAWFDLDMKPDANGEMTVLIEKRPFLRQGDASNWLMSDAFDLPSARSLDAERALNEAAAVLSAPAIDVQQARAIDSKLRGLLGDTDPFWIRWQYVGEKQGWL